MSQSLHVEVDRQQARIGERFAVTFQRTLRIPDDDQQYPLPPGLGAFPLHRVEDFRDRVPGGWLEEGGIFLPMYQREALWLGFAGAEWKPNAVKIGVGRVNALTGEEWNEELHDDPQDYIVCPDQPWLDGINAGTGFVRQFVAMPLGSGYTIEAQVTGREEFGGIQIVVYEPLPGRFPDAPPPSPSEPDMAAPMMFGMPELAGEAAEVAMGIGAGGQMRQKIYPDSYGVETWDRTNCGRLVVHIVNSEQYREITGESAPPTPVSAAEYTAAGLPWFDLYDEARGDLAASAILSRVGTIKQQDIVRGKRLDLNDTSIDVAKSQIEKLHRSQSGEGSNQ